MKMLKKLFIVALVLAVFASCNDEEDNLLMDSSRVQVVMKTSTGDAVTLKSAKASPLNLDKLFINISEIEFDISDDMEDVLSGNNTTFSDIELRGPFPINLLSEEASNGLVLLTTNVPNGIYEEIEFEFDIYKGDENEFQDLRGSTIYAEGTFAMGDVNTPFVIKSDEELEIELEYEDGGLVLDGNNSKVFIDLNLNMLVENWIQSASLDFAKATIEEDGSILIDEDTNEELLDKFEDAIEDAFEAIEDDDDDDDDDD